MFKFTMRVYFYRTEVGNEPVREWLKTLNRDDLSNVNYLCRSATTKIAGFMIR
jgi:hypothetical protein